jgi:hypothetical protein
LTVAREVYTITFMAITGPLKVKELRLDLHNFRTVPQSSEIDALHAMISIAPERFWALTESLLESGYLPTENIIVLQDSNKKLNVKEGNRRIGALKIIYGYLSDPGLHIPAPIAEKIKKVTSVWKKANEEVPCAIYEPHEEALADKIVTLAHGKGEKAGRDNWTSVARARHNRDKNNASEPGLDLLEKYLGQGRNLTHSERDLWAGAYPLTVLDEAAGRIAPRIGLASSRDLANQYPSIQHRGEVEAILKDIGNESIMFEMIRDKNQDFMSSYGIPSPATSATTGAGTTSGQQAAGAASSGGRGTSAKKVKAVSTNDPRSVKRTLRHFSPRGKGRDKVVTLLQEARLLKLDKHPHAFCFLLRAMFELSAKAYCADHARSGLSVIDKKTGKDKFLAIVLNEITNHLTAGKPKTDPLCRSLYGAITELKKKDGLLSVTAMNQLVHNPSFVIDEKHICVVFTNVFPLLDHMNR